MSPMVAHATVSATDDTVKVLLVAKDPDVSTNADVDVCVRGGSLSYPAVAKSLVSTTGEILATTGISYGGFTWDGTVEGEKLGTSTATQLVGVDGGINGICYSVSVPPLSAIVIQAPRATPPAVTISAYDNPLLSSTTAVSVTVDFSATAITTGLTMTVSFKRLAAGGSTVYIAGKTISLPTLAGTAQVNINIPSR